LFKNSLVVTTFYGLKNGDLLADDLNLFLQGENYNTYVIFLDWDAKFTTGVYRKNGTIIFCYSCRFLSKSNFLKWALISPLAFLHFFRYLKRIRIDVFSSFSPVIATWFFAVFFRNVEKRALFYFDFFPIHHVQVGIIRNIFLKNVLYLVEQRLVKLFDFVGCMSRRNVDYFISYFSYDIGKVHEVPLWASSEGVEKNTEGSNIFKVNLGIKKTDLLLLFGGQLEKGRGIEFLCKLAEEICLNKLPVTILVLGKGSQERLIRNAAKNFSSLKYLGSVPKNQYKSFLSVVDVGLAITVGGVDVPTYPSKIMEYCSYSLPILANIESTSDVGEILQNYDAGYASEAGDMDKFLYDLSRLQHRKRLEQMSANSYNLFMDRHVLTKALINFKIYINE
jgi:hypothetical protein